MGIWDLEPVPSMQIIPQDTTATSPYDTVWTQVPEQQPEGLERVMLAEDKLFVVLAVVLIIWFGLLFFLYRTDRRLDRLERSLERGISQDPDESVVG